jgi:hypothetical protein
LATLENITSSSGRTSRVGGPPETGEQDGWQRARPRDVAQAKALSVELSNAYFKMPIKPAACLEGPSIREFPVSGFGRESLLNPLETDSVANSLCRGQDEPMMRKAKIRVENSEFRPKRRSGRDPQEISTYIGEGRAIL